jgi:hypothetical protein
MPAAAAFCLISEADCARAGVVTAKRAMNEKTRGARASDRATAAAAGFAARAFW